VWGFAGWLARFWRCCVILWVSNFSFLFCCGLACCVLSGVLGLFCRCFCVKCLINAVGLFHVVLLCLLCECLVWRCSWCCFCGVLVFC